MVTSKNLTITKQQLNNADKRLRKSLKRVLHLPITCSNYILYAPLRMGGLGIFRFATSTPLTIEQPPRFWSGEDFIRAIHLRHNLLPTKGIPSNPVAEKRCRAGCQKSESLSHVLQQCPLTHWHWIRRHNYVADRINKDAQRKGWTVTSEPHFRGSDGLLKKPDLLLEKDDKVIVCDVAVQWEGPRRLTVGYEEKVAHYSTAPLIECLRNKYQTKKLYLLPCIVGARGAWLFCPKFKNVRNWYKCYMYIGQ